MVDRHCVQRPQLSTRLTDQIATMSVAGGLRQATPVPQRPGVTQQVVSTKMLKVSTPEMFDGSPEKLEDFLMQLKLYLLFNSAQFQAESDKVLYASSYL